MDDLYDISARSAYCKCFNEAASSCASENKPGILSWEKTADKEKNWRPRTGGAIIAGFYTDDPMDVTIYHNARCGTSRNTLALIREAGI